MIEKPKTIYKNGLNQNQVIVDLYYGSKYWSDKATEKIKELKEENGQLKQQLSDLRKENYGNLDGLTYKDEVEIPKLSERISDLECENEQLKQKNKRLKEEIEQLKQALNRNIEVKEFLLEEELELNDTARSFIKEHNKERYK